MKIAVLAFTAATCFAQPFVISTIAGGGPGSGPALTTSVPNPQAITSDAAGNIYYVALSSVYKLDTSGNLTRIAGVGLSGYTGDGGLAINAKLDGPTALAADSAGNVYIGEGGGHIRKVGTDGIITTIAGNGVCHGGCFSNGAGDGGPATSVQLFYPWQLAVDSGGNVYFAEWGTPRVRKISTSGIITTVVGNGKSGYSGDGGPATSAMIGEAWGLAVDNAGTIYLSDNIGGDDYAPDAVRVRKVTLDGIITTIAGTGAPGESPDTGDGGPATAAQFRVATALAVDSAGNLYISDDSHIRRVSPDGVITTVAGNGQWQYSGDGGPATSAAFSGTYYGPSLAFDPAGNLYLSDTSNNRIRKISRDGIINTVAGNGIGCCISGDGGPATRAQLYVPTGIVVDSSGNVYVADTFNNRVRKIDPTGVITTYAGTGTPFLESGDGGPAAKARLAWPTGLRLDSSGNLYIAEAGNMRVRKVSPDGTITTIAGSSPSGPGYSGDGGAATDAVLSWPKDIALDAQGNLYIADTGNNAIRKVSPAGVITTFAHVNGPSGITVDGSGTVYTNDGARVVKISAQGTTIPFAGTGVKGYSGDGGPAIAAQLTNPTGLMFDRAGNLFVGDGASVRMVSPDGIISTVAGNGVVGFTGDGGPATSAQTGAWGLAFDNAGRLYVADPWDNVVRLLK
jgi:sugar lactone lactonase YvrE